MTQHDRLARLHQCRFPPLFALPSLARDGSKLPASSKCRLRLLTGARLAFAAGDIDGCSAVARSVPNGMGFAVILLMLRTDFCPSPKAYPFESRWFDGPQGRMHYLDEGRGTTILLVHGNPTWSFLYRKVVPELTALGFRCVAPDLLGYGLSEHPARFRFTASEQADALLSFVRALGLGSLIVFGQDWGGPLALRVATQMSDAIRGVVLGSTFAWPSSGITRLIGHALRSRVVQRYMVDGERFIGHVMRLARTRLTPEELDHYRLVAATRELRSAKAVLPRELIDADDWLGQLESDIPRVLGSTRTLLFQPQRDAFSASYVRRLARLLPEHVVRKLPNAGHFFQEDAPSDVASAIGNRFG